MNKTNHETEFDWIGLVMVFLLGIWLVLVAAAPQYFLWLTLEVMESSGVATPVWDWPVFTLLQGVFMLGPAALLAFFWYGRMMGTIFQVWMIAAAYFLWLAPVRFADISANQLTALLQAGFTAIFLAVLVGVIWRQQKKADPTWRPQLWRGHTLWPAWLVAPLPLLWWFLFGALGSPLDSLLNLLVGLLVGLVAGITMAFFFLRPQTEKSTPTGWTMVGGGLVAGIMLLLLGGGVGHNGTQLFLIPFLPVLGWGMMAVAQWSGKGQVGKSWLAMALLVGLNAAAPLMLLDPDELILILNIGQRDILTWAIYALLGGIAFGLLVSVVALAIRLWSLRAGQPESPPRWRPLGIAGAIIVWLVVVLLYALVGQPGFHGERLFVIMQAQADVSAAADMPDYTARRQFVYDTLVAQANSSQTDIRATLDSLGIDYTPYYLVNALEVEAGPFLRFWLSTRPEVDRILDSPVLRPLPALAHTATGSASAPTGGPEWNLTDIGADQVWADFAVQGQGIVIGQSDSGVQGDHPELAETYRGRDSGNDYNWFDPWNHTADPTDIGGHGTHTLGSIVGQNVGIAPAAEWIGCVNLARNLANPALYLDCMQFMLAPFPQGGDPLADGDPAQSAHVLNNSWGCPDIEGCDPDVFLPAVQALRYAGIFVVVSAGNDGTGGCETVSDPLAIYDEVFSVGALDEFGSVTGFSSQGPVMVDGSGRVKPDILAPGAGVLSAFPNNSYEVADGTSMAGPHVVGVVALIWSANPDLIGDIETTEQILRETATPYTGLVTDWCGSSGTPNNLVGYGVVNAYAAVVRALTD